MKKSNFVALVLGAVSMVLFALGMCMAMLPQWNAFQPGVVIGCVGLMFALVTVLIWRKMEHKSPIHITGKAVGTLLLSIFGALALGVGMCCTMVWGIMIPGIVIGLVGIMLLIGLIPLCKGLQ